MSQVVVGKLLKGLFSGGVAFLGTLGTALSGHEGFTAVTAQQWVWIALATLSAIGGTYGLAGWSGPGIGNGGNPKAGG